MPIIGIVASSYAAVSSFDSIDSAVATSNQSAFEFASIPNTYKHLRLHVYARSTRAFSNGDLLDIRFNDATTGYYDYTMYGGNLYTSVNIDLNFDSQNHIDVRRVPGSVSDSNMFGAWIIDILDYKNTSKVKSLISKGGVAAQLGQDSNQSCFEGAWWNNTNAINKISIRTSYGENFVPGSSVSLYGLKG